MKKCARCGLLNQANAEACSNCGFNVFAQKPADAPREQSTPQPATSGVTVHRHGSMVTLRCRTPAEACLIRDSLESAEVIALLPDENEMALQYGQKGFVELEIPADAYESNSDLRSVVEFSAPPPQPPGIGLTGKVMAMFLAAVIVPGLLIFALLLTSYRKHGEDRKARELKLWFLIGLAFWLLFIIASIVLSN